MQQINMVDLGGGEYDDDRRRGVVEAGLDIATRADGGFSLTRFESVFTDSTVTTKFLEDPLSESQKS
jgi:hypothetical protein